MAVIGIHPDNTNGESYSDRWTEFIRKNGHSVRLVNFLSPDCMEEARGCDGIMWRFIHSPSQKNIASCVLNAIETCLDKPVFPNWNTRWHYDEKVAQFYLLKACKAPTPQTWVFWDESSALSWAKTTAYPKVFKLSSGASSSNVIKINSYDQAASLIKRMFHRGIFPSNIHNNFSYSLLRDWNQIRKTISRFKQGLMYGFSGIYPPLSPFEWRPEKESIYFQDFVPGNLFDTRITIIGNRAFGFRRFNRPGDFRASGSGLLDYETAKVDLNCVKIAFKVSREMGFQSMAYDFLFQNGEPLISEISYTFLNRAVYQCPGFWDEELHWHEKQLWPEHAQAEDFLNLVTI